MRLCSQCNTGIGSLGDDKVGSLLAVDYITRTSQMPSRSNDTNKDKAYGAPMGYQPPVNVGRPVATPSNSVAVRAAMAADKGTTRPAPAAPVKRYTQPAMPLAKPGEEPVGIGGAKRRDKIFSTVDKM